VKQLQQQNTTFESRQGNAGSTSTIIKSAKKKIFAKAKDCASIARTSETTLLVVSLFVFLVPLLASSIIGFGANGIRAFVACYAVLPVVLCSFIRFCLAPTLQGVREFIELCREMMLNKTMHETELREQVKRLEKQLSWLSKFQMAGNSLCLSYTLMATVSLAFRSYNLMVYGINVGVLAWSIVNVGFE
jgi:hypothetical protein